MAPYGNYGVSASAMSKRVDALPIAPSTYTISIPGKRSDAIRHQSRDLPSQDVGNLTQPLPSAAANSTQTMPGNTASGGNDDAEDYVLTLRIPQRMLNAEQASSATPLAPSIQIVFMPSQGAGEDGQRHSHSTVSPTTTALLGAQQGQQVAYSVEPHMHRVVDGEFDRGRGQYVNFIDRRSKSASRLTRMSRRAEDVPKDAPASDKDAFIRRWLQGADSFNTYDTRSLPAATSLAALVKRDTDADSPVGQLSKREGSVESVGTSHGTSHSGGAQRARQRVGNSGPPQRVGNEGPQQKSGNSGPPQRTGNLRRSAKRVAKRAESVSSVGTSNDSDAGQRVGNSGPPQQKGNSGPPQPKGNSGPPQRVGNA